MAHSERAGLPSHLRGYGFVSVSRGSLGPKSGTHAMVAWGSLLLGHGDVGSIPASLIMKVTEHKTTQITGSVHPHGHKDQNVGPFDLRIGINCQPAALYGKGQNPKTVLLCVEQPNERDNFTLIKLLYLRTGTRKPSFVAGCKFHNARQYRRGGTIEVRIKKRYCDSFPSPLPVGRYTGTCMYDEAGSFVLFILQAMTLVKEPEPSKPKTIITPGDPEYGLTLRDVKRTLHGAYGVDGRGTDASRLRDG